MTNDSTNGCPCRRCAEATDRGGAQPLSMMRMFLCSVCGNKRCPHATNHRLACTGSNVAGQAGSDYGSPLLTESGVRELLNAHGRENGTVSAWATMKGIHPETALVVARGARPAAKTILTALGLRQIRVYGPLRADGVEPVCAEPPGSDAPDLAALQSQISVLQGKLERALFRFEAMADNVARQAECLVHCAEMKGEKSGPVPSVYHIQASHFIDLAIGARTTLADLGSAGL